ncbi:proline--tRNA ligase [Temperatibacter marinus]|uniref:Proline--tRNA ligase n=1 Tax=Temperatibacter marinus TaxID=1456591 RepID=A0AA52EH30_9PROT|nr:proline--tRNA ligase [Temperatibacter marinus]WND02397.1 proline--tRNA ligase [Temperatibacter marinus]
MRVSRYFLPTLKETPADAQIASHIFMLRAGMVRQSASGIYTWLPLGLRVLKKIEDIVREEQNKAGALEVLMPTIQSADLWKKSGRYDDYGKEMLRISDRKDAELLYGPTNEELITDIFSNEVKSYKDLPKNLYHIQWKFRDEIRPRFGVMRGREFLMKDAYSFDVSAEAGRDSYNAMFTAYLRTFARMGLKAMPMRADTGPIGGDLSHEFLVIAETGESEVFFHKGFEDLDPMVETHSAEERQSIVDTWTSMYAATDEIHNPETCDVADSDLIQGRGIEVGHIFFFGDKYSAPMGASVQGPDGKLVNVQMGSYGVGVSRLVGGIIESSHDENGIIWPESVAPFKIGLINLGGKNDDCVAFCDDLYAQLEAAGIEVLYDDTKNGAGAKFSQMDLIGLPWQIAVGPRGLKNGVVEVKNRKTGEKVEMTPQDALTKFS